MVVKGYSRISPNQKLKEEKNETNSFQRVWFVNHNTMRIANSGLSTCDI